MLISEKIVIFAFFAVTAAILAILDHRRNWLPDCLTFPLAVAGLLINLHDTLASFNSALIGLIAGYTSIRILQIAQLLIIRRTGIGLGDAKLLAALGAWLGWQALPVLVVGAALLMLAVYFRRPEKPFGTGLASVATAMLTTNLLSN